MVINFLEQLRIFADIVLAGVLGFIIGYERKMRSKEAGIRTHTILCVGSALIMVISRYGFLNLNADYSRLASNVVTGVGFIGAGIIIYRNHEIHGLTTAAGIFATSGIGMACGARLYYIALFSTVLVIGIQLLLHCNIKALKMKKYITYRVSFYQEEGEREKVLDFFKTKHFDRIIFLRQEDKIVCNVVIYSDYIISSSDIYNFVSNDKNILSFDKNDEENS